MQKSTNRRTERSVGEWVGRHEWSELTGRGHTHRNTARPKEEDATGPKISAL
jgi:hypothetical protein